MEFQQTHFVEKDDYAVIAMVEQGLGVSIMPKPVLKGTSRKVVALELEPSAHRDLGIAYRDDKMLSVAAKKFIQHAKKWIGAG